MVKDLTGQKFGRLTVLNRTDDYISPNNEHCVSWMCKCDCGKIIKVIGNSLKRGHTKSCGCLNSELRKERTKHGKHKTRLYSIWSAMKERCNNPKMHQYIYYGGRGIKVCNEWLYDFQAFYDWAMSNGYRDDLTIDRKDVNGNYEPDNCKWVTMKEQANNRRSCRLLTYNGKTQTIKQWSNETGINYNTLIKRINHNWSIEKALNTP